MQQPPTHEPPALAAPEATAEQPHTTPHTAAAAPPPGIRLPAPAVRVQDGAAGPAPLRVRLARRVVRAILSTVFRLEVTGQGLIPAGPAIICPNHLGWTDPFLVFALFPAEPRVYVLGERAGVLSSQFRIQVLDAMQIMIPLERERPLEATRLMAGVVRRGGSLLIFPEGHLGQHEGDLLPLQPGAAHLSLLTGAPLVPVGLTGVSDLWLRRTITVRIGPPLAPADFAGGSLHAGIKGMTAALDGALRALLPGDAEQARWKPLRNWLTHLF